MGLIFLLQHCQSEASSFSIDTKITIIGLIVGIALFIIERILNYIREVREANHNWFLNIILSPQLEELNKFYTRTNDDLKVAVNDLVSVSVDMPHLDFLALQREKIDGFKNTRRNYFNNFSSMIRSYDPILANNFDMGVNKLDDIYTEALDQPEQVVDFNTITLKIYENKSKIISLLFNVVKRKNMIQRLFSSK